MPFLKFIWSDEDNGENHTDVGYGLNSGIFDVVNPSSIRFPKLTLIEDIPISQPLSHDHFMINLDVSDIDAKDLRINPTDRYVYVEGKREEFNGKSWVHVQVCRRISLPAGQKVKSVHSKRLSYGRISLTVNMKKIEEGAEDLPRPKTVLVCEGVVQEESTSTGPRYIKVTKIQPKIVKFVLREQLEQLALNIQPTQQVENNAASSREIVAPEQLNIQVQLEEEEEQLSLYEESVTQNTSSSKSIADVEPVPAQAVVKPEQLRENPDKGEACPRKLADEESDGNSEATDSESTEEAENRYPNIDPRSIWADLTAIAEDEDNPEWDLEEQDKTHLPTYLRYVF